MVSFSAAPSIVFGVKVKLPPAPTVTGHSAPWTRAALMKGRAARMVEKRIVTMWLGT